MDDDGFLGGKWFADKVWEFDYLHHKLKLIKNNKVKVLKPKNQIKLGFQLNDSGQRTMHFASMEVVIDGETIPVLFDTGATASLSKYAKEYLQIREDNIATSFIIASVFDKWHKQHPDWLVIEKAEASTGYPMIQVPEVNIAGHIVGPVWFTYRNDSSFHPYMSQLMDRKIDGALGGLAFKFFKITVDYPNATALFEK